MLSIAITDSTWQVIGTGIAAIAALASWAAVVIALRAAGDAREAERNASRPLLLLAPAYATAGPLAPTMTLSIHNAGRGHRPERRRSACHREGLRLSRPLVHCSWRNGLLR